MFTRHYKVWPKDLPKTMTLPKTSLYTNLEVSALRYPDHNAIVFYDAPMTYARLKQEVDTMAGYLQAQGVKKGDRVLLYMQNSPQYVISYYAILRADAVVIPVNPMNRAARLSSASRLFLLPAASRAFPFYHPSWFHLSYSA